MIIKYVIISNLGESGGKPWDRGQIRPCSLQLEGQGRGGWDQEIGSPKGEGLI